MNLDLITGLVTWGIYAFFDQGGGAYKASWWVHAVCMIWSILILKFTPDLDYRVRIFVVMILAWHVVDLLTNAIDDGLKNDADYKACTSTASILSDVQIDERKSRPSSPVKDSMSNSSEQPTEESTPPRTSTSPRQSTDAPRAT
jgi:hypothetical protein